MYTNKNYQTKKALIEDVKAGKPVGYFGPGCGFGLEPTDGQITVEGPHYPQAHRWYAQCDVVNGLIVRVRR